MYGRGRASFIARGVGLALVATTALTAVALRPAAADTLEGALALRNRLSRFEGGRLVYEGPGHRRLPVPCRYGKTRENFFCPSPSAENLSDPKSLNTTLGKNRRPGREPAGKRESRRMTTITGTAFL